MEIEILSSTDAIINGYLSLTTPYDQDKPHEVQWMNNVLRDLKGCSIILIETALGYEVARHKSEMILAEPRK
jgi:hypothetical protein